MDGVLRVISSVSRRQSQQRFNPCSNGWCTSRDRPQAKRTGLNGVSILVLMDGVLRENPLALGTSSPGVSILVLMDGVLRASVLCRLPLRRKVSILVLMDGVLRV